MNARTTACYVGIAIFLVTIAGVLLTINSQPDDAVVASNEATSDFLPRESDYYQIDQIVGHVHRPNARREFPWPDHPRGTLVLKTNNLGFRENLDTSTQRMGNSLRILVTGDSHTDGVVYNEESFPNLLEQALSTQYPRKELEVLNGGTGYFGPHHYTGFLRKYLTLSPDIFIVVIYTGNDFLDAARILEHRDGEEVERPEEYYKNLQLCCVGRPDALSQALNQIYYLKSFPDMKPRVIEFTKQELLEIRKLCSGHGIELIVVLLPTKLDVEWGSDAGLLDTAKRLLALTDKDLQINRGLARTISRWLGDEDFKYVDLYRSMAHRSEELFWKADYHLNHRGHALIADELHRFLKPTLETFVEGRKEGGPPVKDTSAALN